MSRESTLRRLRTAALVGGFAAAASCFDRGTRWEEPPPEPPSETECVAGSQRCAVGKLELCATDPAGVIRWNTVEDCTSQGLVCAGKLLACAVCLPDEATCDGPDVMQCRTDGSGADKVSTCDAKAGNACREGGCVNLCALAAEERSNVGCEYWAVDLDNAMIDATSNAAAQQFAVVVSNAQPDVATEVHIFQDDGDPGDAPKPYEIATANISPFNLQVFKLGPREVDGSPPGEYNTGTHTALTRHAYKIVTNFPVVAYQFSPLENVSVFSNDASLLKPREALAPEGNTLQPTYIVASWPQTIAATDDPDTNFNPNFPIHLRAFLTIVGTAENTHVRVTTKAGVVAGGPVAETPVGGVIDTVIGAFDVLNLETGDFNADFTGSLIESDQAIAVFTGSEASDAPHFETLADRRCCADHLEEQLDPLRTAGKSFVIAHSPSRTRGVDEAGGNIAITPEPDYVRFVAASTKGATIKTTLPAPDDEIQLKYRGDFYEVTVWGNFMAESNEPVSVAQISASQQAAQIKTGLPGGDPSLLIEPPREQFRKDYVFLTPDKYVFDFISIVAPPDAYILLDDYDIHTLPCEATPADGLTEEERGSPTPPFLAWTCQLGFPAIDPLKVAPDNVLPGVQNDGVHRLNSDQPIGVVISGWDSYVSYAYAAGTELKTITVPQ